jgi:hypothetical protein
MDWTWSKHAVGGETKAPSLSNGLIFSLISVPSITKIAMETRVLLSAFMVRWVHEHTTYLG